MACHSSIRHGVLHEPWLVRACRLSRSAASRRRPSNSVFPPIRSSLPAARGTLLSLPYCNMATTRVNAGPLTTRFSPPPSCRTANFRCGGATPCVSAVSLQPMPWVSSCWPPFSITGVDRYGVYFSPGLCPSGWSAAWNATSGDTFRFFPGMATVDAHETIGACCPSGYDVEFAARVVTDGPISHIPCASSLREQVTAYDCVTETCVIPTCPPGLDRTACGVLAGGVCHNINPTDCTSLNMGTTNAIGATRIAYEDAVIIRWRDPDFPDSGAGAPNPTTTQPGDPGAGGGGPSTGTRVGVGVGVGLGGLLGLVLLVWWCLRMRRRARQAGPPRAGVEELAADERAELAGKAIDSEPRVSGAGLGGVDDASDLHVVRGLAPEALPAERGEEAPAELDAGPRGGTAPVGVLSHGTQEPPVEEAGTSVAGWPAYQEVRETSVLRETDRGKPPEADTAVVEGSSAGTTTAAAAAATATLGGPGGVGEKAAERERLAQEEKRLSDQRARVQETIRLLGEDERLRLEQEEVRRRLEELQRDS